MQLLNNKYSSFIFGILSLVSFGSSIFIFSSKYRESDYINAYAVAVFGASFVLALIGIVLGIRAIRRKNRNYKKR